MYTVAFYPDSVAALARLGGQIVIERLRLLKQTTVWVDSHQNMVVAVGNRCPFLIEIRFSIANMGD